VGRYQHAYSYRALRTLYYKSAFWYFRSLTTLRCYWGDIVIVIVRYLWFLLSEGLHLGSVLYRCLKLSKESKLESNSELQQACFKLDHVVAHGLHIPNSSIGAADIVYSARVIVQHVFWVQAACEIGDHHSVLSFYDTTAKRLAETDNANKCFVIRECRCWSSLVMTDWADMLFYNSRRRTLRDSTVGYWPAILSISMFKMSDDAISNAVTALLIVVDTRWHAVSNNSYEVRSLWIRQSNEGFQADVDLMSPWSNHSLAQCFTTGYFWSAQRSWSMAFTCGYFCWLELILTSPSREAKVADGSCVARHYRRVLQANTLSCLSCTACDWLTSLSREREREREREEKQGKRSR